MPVEVSRTTVATTGAAILILRVVIGVVMAAHGFDKLGNGFDATEQFFDEAGVPVPALAAPVVTLVEIVGGIALVLGVATRVFAVALGAVLVGAIVYVQGENGLLGGYELDITLLAGLVALALLGAGPLSADSQVRAFISRRRHGGRDDATPAPSADPVPEGTATR